MVEAVWNETPQQSFMLSPQPQTTLTPQYLQISYGNVGNISRRESLLSPSTNRRSKIQRGIAGKLKMNQKKENKNTQQISAKYMKRRRQEFPVHTKGIDNNRKKIE